MFHFTSTTTLKHNYGKEAWLQLLVDGAIKIVDGAIKMSRVFYNYNWVILQNMIQAMLSLMHLTLM